MIMKGDGPFARQGLLRSPGDVGWNTHPNKPVGPQIDEMQGRDDLNHGMDAAAKLVFVNRIVPHNAISEIAQDGLKETNLEGFAQVEDAEAIVRHAISRIAESTGGFSVAQRIRVPIEIDSAEGLAARNGCHVEGHLREGVWWVGVATYAKARAAFSAAASASPDRPAWRA